MGSVACMPMADLAIIRKVPIRLTWITLVKVARSCGSMELVSLTRREMRLATPMPAQLTRMRSWPCALRAAASAASTLASLVTSHLAKMPPSSLASFSPASALRSSRATFTPLAASARAVAAPRPEAPPVTTAGMVLSSCIACYSPLRATALARRRRPHPLHQHGKRRKSQGDDMRIDELDAGEAQDSADQLRKQQQHAGEREEEGVQRRALLQEAALEGEGEDGDAGERLRSDEEDIDPAAALRHLQQQTHAQRIAHEHEGHQEGGHGVFP